jgi:hypothetical protein
MFNSYHGYSLGLSPLFFIGFGILAAIIAIVVVILKGYSLWYAARRGEKWWFIALLVINTVGILELIYLIFVVKKWHKGVSAPASNSSASSSPSTPASQV